jgi:malate synthase
MGAAMTIELRVADDQRYPGICTPEALALVERLHLAVEGGRREALAARPARRGRIAAGQGEIADAGGDWRVPPAPPPLADRRVEITGPTDRKMLINALNSGARTFMADLEDANVPVWTAMLDGQVNLHDAVRRTIAFDTPEKAYRLVDDPAVLLVRPRGWHLVEHHVVVGGQPVAAGLVDAGLYLFHNAHELLARGAGPYLYLPKLEGGREAALWAEAFALAEDLLDLPRGTIRATVLIETLPAAFEMDAILSALRDHVTGLNAGRWDYIFSTIKVLADHPRAVLPDRAQVTMTVPFMRAYTQLLVRTCHRRGAHAIGGMAAFVPNRREPDVTRVALERVREDKEREARDGFDGTWVAHPDLVPVAMEAFDAALGSRPNQLDRTRDDVDVSPDDLLDVRVPGGTITEAGLRNDVAVALRYLDAWYAAHGAVTIFDLMEDTATAEIARTQVWQWRRHGARLEDGRDVDDALLRTILDEEAALVAATTDDPARFDRARTLFERLVFAERLEDFLTLAAIEGSG